MGFRGWSQNIILIDNYLKFSSGCLEMEQIGYELAYMKSSSAENFLEA